MKTAAIYARVSSDKQREENTIASQTAALIAFAREQQFEVPQEWVFEDDGYSGASLIRPGLERVRDLAAEGLIQAILVYAPDRLSRRYAHQILLIEELARAGVETLFVRAPRGSTPEDELLLQFQGMIAEYERAQILERSRRGKRHRARQGEVSVLSGAPFGYHFIRKTDHSAAYYEIDEEQARIVRRMFELYCVEGLSIGAIARLLNEQAIPTCKRRGRWERSTVWGMLRNPAYKGQACFGKTTIAPRQRITRPIRMRGGVATRNSANHERPRKDWITIAVPPIVSEETFALAQERLEANKAHAPRRTVTPSVVQGLVSCAKCGYSAECLRGACCRASMSSASLRPSAVGSSSARAPVAQFLALSTPDHEQAGARIRQRAINKVCSGHFVHLAGLPRERDLRPIEFAELLELHDRHCVPAVRNPKRRAWYQCTLRCGIGANVGNVGSKRRVKLDIAEG